MTATTHDRTLVGNRWVLVGAIVYLLEWVAIIWVGVLGVGETVIRGGSLDDVRNAYDGHQDALTTMAGWFAVVLLRRVLVFIGLRQSMADSGHRHLLMDFAVAAAALSVTLEVASYGMAAAAGGVLESGDEAGMLAIDQAAAGLNLMIGGGVGLAILSSAYVMWRSGLFPMVLNVVGVVSGVALVGAQLTVAPSLQSVFDILFIFPIVFWVWMLWTGVFLWRRTPRRVV